MITVYIYTNSNDEIYSFRVNDHGKSIVCAAVSALTFNTINSIEVLTSEPFKYELEEDGGFIFFEVPALKDNQKRRDVSLLLDSFLLGIDSIKDSYTDDVKLTIINTSCKAD